MIAKQDVLDRAAEWGLRPDVVEKDYVLGWLLAAISQHAECGFKWVFKGGTCLKKCFFETYRFSEDLDFTLLPEATYSSDAIRSSLAEVAARAYELSGIQFREATVKPRRNKQGQETFEGRVYYQGPLQMPNWPKVSFDLSQHEKVFPPFDRRPIYHAYPDGLPEQAVIQTYSFPELLGEKLRALLERTRPRDLYDVVFIVESRAVGFTRDCIRGSWRQCSTVGEGHDQRALYGTKVRPVMQSGRAHRALPRVCLRASRRHTVGPAQSGMRRRLLVTNAARGAAAQS